VYTYEIPLNPKPSKAMTLYESQESIKSCKALLKNTPEIRKMYRVKKRKREKLQDIKLLQSHKSDRHPMNQQSVNIYILRL
jgi:hypothetical protein